jgi:hypothetical protein
MIQKGRSVKIADDTPPGTVADLFEAHVQYLKDAEKPSWKEIQKGLNKIADTLGRNRPAREIEPDEIVEVIRPIYEPGKKAMADHVRSYVHAAYPRSIRRQSSGFAARNKIAVARRPPLALRPLSLRSAVPARPARRLVIAVKAAMGAADPTKGITTMTDHDVSDFEPPHASSSAELALAELQLYGYRPFQDEPDPRPLPEAKVIGGAVADIFDALVSRLQDTRLEPDLQEFDVRPRCRHGAPRQARWGERPH